MAKVITRYVRDKNGNRTGILLAQDGKIGWSKCHVGLDVFDREKAKNIALIRMESPIFNRDGTLPDEIRKTIYKFVRNTANYYKIPIEKVECFHIKYWREGFNNPSAPCPYHRDKDMDRYRDFAQGQADGLLHMLDKP